MSSIQDSESWIALCLVDGLGAESIRRLVDVFGTPGNIFEASVTSLERVVKRRVAHNILQGPDQKKLLTARKWLECPGNSAVTLTDADYPSGLRNIADPPPLLYLKGRRELLNAPVLAVVGSRSATPAGIVNAETFSEAMSNAGLCIVSGMASGIDTAAHRGGLRGASSSIAVVGTGLDTVYPAANRSLAHELAEKGLLVSEFSLGTPPLGSNFPRRNRIISGMSSGCLVVEAALQSGSLITARQALEQGREVFAIPGSIHSPLSRGCHSLIKEGAKLVEKAEDILDELGFVISSQSLTGEGDEPNQESFLKHLGYDVMSIDLLSQRSGLTVETVSAMLLSLELDGKVASLPGGVYQRVR
ncbi:MAG TPA: DNA-processing protein DprA [Nitrosospira sp.]|nr:DNA-processing protein DprA [Nitrosospira sp.]